MREIQSNNDSLSIQWINKLDDKYLVKFKTIDVPIEMDDKYYKSIMKYLQN
jgi:hypothetical protein